MAKRDAVGNFIEDNPDCTLEQIRERFPKISKAKLAAALEAYQERNWPTPPDPTPEEMQWAEKELDRVQEEWRKSPDYPKHRAEHRAHMDVMRVIWDLGKNHPDKIAAALPYIPIKATVEFLAAWAANVQEAQRRQESPFDTEREHSGPTRKMAQDVVVDIYEPFARACAKQGISVRQGLHAAMWAFAKQYGEEPYSKIV
jgi:hypothetical protein